MRRSHSLGKRKPWETTSLATCRSRLCADNGTSFTTRRGARCTGPPRGFWRLVQLSLGKAKPGAVAMFWPLQRKLLISSPHLAHPYALEAHSKHNTRTPAHDREHRQAEAGRERQVVEQGVRQEARLNKCFEPCPFPLPSHVPGRANPYFRDRACGKSTRGLRTMPQHWT